MKHLIPVMIILLLLSTSFLGAGNQTKNIEVENEGIEQSAQTLLAGPADSPWPMYCHDTRHSGQSLYSTVNNSGDEIWRFKLYENSIVDGSPVIDNDGIIYFGGADFYALYPNGTLKWMYDIDSWVHSCPVINENGTIYIGNVGGGSNFLYAINPDGTLKWRYSTWEIYSSPVIGKDGTVYFGDENKYIYALWPNGTLRWRYRTGHVVYSSPAIGEDDTVYCGSHDTYIYALYPNNGTLKWKFKTGHWIRTSPCIADDGTIYVVSLDNYLYAINPDGTLKWKTNLGEAGTSPTIGWDGTIYVGYHYLHAINPVNGSLKWSFDLGPGRTIRGSTPCHSAEGIIYFGTHIGDYAGGEIIAVNSEGTEQWRKEIANMYVDSAPAIGEDGFVYIGSACDDHGYNLGYLHAFGPVNSNKPPADPFIDGPSDGEAEKRYKFTLEASDPDNNPVYFFIDWGDGNTTKTRTYASGEEGYARHSWEKQGIYNIKVKTVDSIGENSNWVNHTIHIVPILKVSLMRPGFYLYVANMELFSLEDIYGVFFPVVVGRLRIEADAEQETVGIDRVEFYINDKLKFTDNSAPYSWSWKQHRFSFMSIKVVAFSNQGDSKSDEVEVLKIF